MTFSCEAFGDAAEAFFSFLLRQAPNPTAIKKKKDFNEENTATPKKMSIRFLHFNLIERETREKRK